MTESLSKYARVLVDIPARVLDRPFTYAVPEELQNTLAKGCIVEVPFKDRVCTGVVIEVFAELSEEEKKLELRYIRQVAEAEPFWGEELMKLVGIIRSLCAGTWYESFQTVVPGPVLRRIKAMFTKKRIITRRKKRQEAISEYPKIPLTHAQEEAVKAVCDSAADGRPVLLYGVTGSGKTEVYLQALEKILSEGREGIVLVPELSLTPQAIERYRGRLGDRVGVLHSALSVADRRDYWWAMRRRELQVAVGTRSAVFAPFENLGLICVDEEHESSYKQENQPRYHARQAAFIRAKEHKAALVLGSATPSLESFYLASRGVYRLVELPQRPGGRSLPEVRLIDMRRSSNAGKLVSGELAEAIRLRLERGQQTVLLLNRRGFAGFMQCPDCGYVPSCPNCSISLTWHKVFNKFLCHYCDYQDSAQVCCPRCRSVNFNYSAPGTERLMAELQQLFPGVEIVRMDRDTTGRIDAHAAILKEFSEGKAQILLGTKMVAKGLDYPNVTLVGILRADHELNQPDFRAGERAFQLLSQASGRAGRGSFGGEVVIQAVDIEHPILQAVVGHNYKAMYDLELEVRRGLLYPPFCRLVRLVVSGLEENLVIGYARHGVRYLRENLKGCEIIGPAPCPITKIKSHFRWHILIKNNSLLKTVEVCSHLVDSMNKRTDKDSHKIRFILDPEPQSLS
ncbi:primosomal protein N' [bacterium]|nr:primosomal protein N' [bacterium]